MPWKMDHASDGRVNCGPVKRATLVYKPSDFSHEVFTEDLLRDLCGLEQQLIVVVLAPLQSLSRLLEK
jgi:hypothetical protein